MLVELGNHNPVNPGPDERPKVTTIAIPEFDDEFRASHEHGVYTHDSDGSLAKEASEKSDARETDVTTAQAFREHLMDAMLYNNGITHLPGHEATLAVEAGWRARGNGRPAWVKVSDHGHPGLTPEGQSAEMEQFLSEFYECPTLNGYYGDCDDETAHTKKELEYWTRFGAPGEFGSTGLPQINNVYTVDGRIMNNNNDGGDALQSVMNGTGTAATATTLTTGQTLVTNATLGHRVYVYTTSGTAFVWGNCISNTNAAGASVITVDQWYTPLTPGGSAGSTPGTPWSWVLVDGGNVSTWFAGLATGANAPANTDHTLATNGNTEYVQAGGALNRKIAPTATDVSATARTVTLVPVWTANGTDVLPKTFTVIGWFASMVVSFGGAGGPMKFETALNVSATLSASGDQLTVTETISGS